jgi:hypothetical protein
LKNEGADAWINHTDYGFPVNLIKPQKAYLSAFPPWLDETPARFKGQNCSRVCLLAKAFGVSITNSGERTLVAVSTREGKMMRCWHQTDKNSFY